MMRPPRLAVVGTVALLLGACDTPPTDPAPPPPIDAQLRPLIQQWGVVPILSLPAQNAALVSLGQALLFDKILSGNRDIACATCHNPATHGTDGLSLAIGTGGTGIGASRTLGAGREFLPRNAPSLLNQGLRAFYVFWDGRVEGFGAGPFRTPPDVVLPPGLPNILAAQAMFPVLSRREMRGAPGDRDVFGNPNELAALPDSQPDAIWQAVMDRLLAIPEYQARFAAAFPGSSLPSLRFRHAATAIAAFVTQAFSKYDSPFDRYLARDDAALSPEAKRGAQLFFGRLQCASCHRGPLIGAEDFANVGVPQIGPGMGSSAPLDIGRGDVIGFVGPSPNFYRFAFRVPPLRNVELTGPYMHDGAYPTLEAVVRHYNDVPAALQGYDVSQLSPALRSRHHGGAATIADQMRTLDFRVRTPFLLTETEQQELVAFLKSLTDPAARDLSSVIPPSVPSGLPVRE